ncbi:McrB family protein [Mucilaginibacter sp.]|uniref:McrB family protein n=1 Tax=Mucilaginibacter sp. TaxID=1882438 RepID=UPI003D138BA5
MTKTLITRISRLEQYDNSSKTILWEDSTEPRWLGVYGQLKINDNTIFIAGNKLLVGVIENINDRKSIACNNIIEVSCSNDQFLQLHEIYPELISRVKANFPPFIHPQEINIKQLIDDANNKRFVSYYILSGVPKYNELAETFKINDRIILVGPDKKLQNVKLHSNSGLIDFPEALNISTSVDGVTLDEMLKINKSIKRKSLKSNNVTRIENIKATIGKTGLYKFNTFFSYYDALYNKRVYGESTTASSSILKIILKQAETVFKVSMGSGEIREEYFKYFNENNLVVVHGATKAKGTSYQTQGDTFSKQMKIGDYFYLCRSNSHVEVIGRITGDASKCTYEDFEDEGWLQRPYEIISEAISDESYQDEKKWWAPNDNSTCIAVPQHEIDYANKILFVPFFNTTFEYEKKLPIETTSASIMKKPLNQILFGPPGTGKTYNTINKAIAIIEDKNEEEINLESRQGLKDRFDTYLSQGKIVFTTFHQSMSYEDFIEGIKPVEPEKEGDPVIYRIEYGVFRNLCIEASFAIAQTRENKTTEEVLDFSILYDKFSEDVEENLLNGKKVELETKTGGKVLVEGVSQKGNIVIKHIDGTRSYTVSKNRLTKLQSVIKDLDDVNNINDQFREIIKGMNSSAYWSVLNAIRKQKQTKTVKNEIRIYTIDEKKEVVASFQKADYKNHGAKPFVLIIDEINRGNVSQIFGELITLIEDDKRLGNEEALETTLPYSKEKFGVPPNLYIIGTMNTADRSVEALDNALRRRFSFEEMPPNSKLVATDGKLKDNEGFLGDLDLPLLLNTINKRIEKLLDKDHLIGHSYFMLVANFADLKIAFHNKIIPLLQEYFFGDYGKIGLVIGKGFFQPIEEQKDDIFAKFDDYDPSVFAEKPVYCLCDISKMQDDTFKTAINLLLKK